MSTLLALAFRDDDGWWTIQIPELSSAGPNGRTIIATGAATTFRGIDKAARELATVWLDAPDEAVNVEVEISIPEEIAQLWEDGTQAERAAREEQSRAVTLRRDAVRALRAKGYPAEAVATALGVSRQRIGQLEKIPETERVAS